jgi:hypothetical protein
MNTASFCQRNSYTGRTQLEPNLSPVRLLPDDFRKLCSCLESALIYVAQNDSYTHSNEDLMQGKGVNDLASIAFEAGKMYKIRVINMSALASMPLSSHDLFGMLTI